jgi:EmrB/QacA subfamily drug resistance transporter
MEKRLNGANRSRWTILFVVVMATFMATLDSSIVNVALPVMSDSMHVTSESIAWIVSAYLIAISAAILIFGKLGDILGQTKVFQFGLIVFTAGSFLCGVTDSFGWLILARVVQAIGAAGTMANSQGIITRSFPENERGRALGINGAFVALGSLFGPPLGGFIISVASWEYLFWINVPIGIIVFLLGIKVYPKNTRTEKIKIDALGAALFVVAIVPLFIALEQSITLGFAHFMIIACLVASAIGFILFYKVEKRGKTPLLPMDIFKNKWFTVSLFCAFISFIAISFSNIIMPFYLQDLLKLSPAMAGLFLAIFPLVLGIIAPISGYLSDRIGSEFLTLLGLILTAVGLFLVSTLDKNPSFAIMGFFIALIGGGNGLFQSPNNSLVMSSLPKKDLGIGGSLNALVRNIGLVVGITLATMILYGGMSSQTGYVVNNYSEGADSAFLYGMRIAFITAGTICTVGAAVTAVRLIGRRKTKTEN